MNVKPDVLQQFIGGKLVQLPVLMVDGKLTEISEVQPVATAKEALEIAKAYAAKLTNQQERNT